MKGLSPDTCLPSLPLQDRSFSHSQKILWFCFPKALPFWSACWLTFVIQLICGALPHPGIKPGSSALQEDSLPSEPPDRPWGSRWHQRGRRKPNKSFLPNYFFVFRGVLHHTALGIAARCSWGHSSSTPQWLLLFCLTIRCLLLC